MNNTGDGFYIGFCSNNTLTNNIAKNNGGVGFLLYHSDKNTLADDIASNNSEGFWLIYSSDNTIINTTAMNNRFHNYTTGYSSFGSPTNAFISAFTNENLGTLTLLAMSFLIMVGMFIFLHSRKKQANSSLKTGKTTIYEKTHTSSILRHNNTSSDQFTKILPTINASKAMVLVEDILKESYQVPDYETAVKIQQGGFPDYGTYKQALDKDIPTYAEWLNYQKEHIKRVL